MIKQTVGMAAIFGLLSAVGGCSSSDPEPAGGAGTSTTGGSAGTSSTGGTSGAATGGTSGAATGGSASGGASGSTGSGGSAGAGTSCKGVGKGDVCLTEGQACAGIVCGLADSGTRNCDCTAGIWVCESCSFVGTPYEFPPDPPAPTCTTEMQGATCPTLGAICTGAPMMEVCACYLDDEMAQIWDCDDIPWE